MQLNKEKVDLENQLEAEQEYIVNKLQKQVRPSLSRHVPQLLFFQLEHLNNEKKKLTHEKVDLENQLEAEQEYIVNKLQKQVGARRDLSFARRCSHRPKSLTWRRESCSSRRSICNVK